MEVTVLIRVISLIMSVVLSTYPIAIAVDRSRELDRPIDKTTEVNIKMVGDCLIHGNLYKQSKQSDGAYNADKLFENIKETIQSADLAIINQETIFTSDESKYSSYPRFGCPTAIGKAARDAGFDIVAHATNHTLDKGLQGVKDTLQFWSNYPDVTILGIHESDDEDDIAYVECKGITFAFVNYTYGLNGLDSLKEGKDYIVDMLKDKDIEQTMARAKSTSDMVVAILHVGDEYVYTPSKYAQKQVDRFINNGADIVLCAHPHVVEGYGMRTTDEGNTALVYYSLGNYISSQNKVPRMIGGLADITITKTYSKGKARFSIKEYSMIPIITHLQSGEVTTYLLSDYTDELCKKHRLLKDTDYTVDKLHSLYESMVKECSYLFE